MNKLTVNRGQGGLGRQPLGQDFISALIFYPTAATLALSKCPVVNGTKLKLGGISDAIAAGINGNHFGETAAVVELVLTHIGSTGDVIQVQYIDNAGNVTILCQYTQLASDTTINILAASITAAINANSGVTGFTAVNTGAPSADISITVKAGEGIFPNTGTPITAIVTNDTGTLFTYTQSVTTSGVASQMDAFYYHIQRYFVQSPNTTLYVGFFTAPVSFIGYAFSEVTTMLNYSNGAIRQVGIYADDNDAEAPTMAHLTANVKSVQAQIAAYIALTQFGVSCFLAPTLKNPTGSLLAAALTDLSSANSEHVSVVIGQDGGALGAHLFAAYGISISNLGDVLGIVSSAQVSDDISWVAQYTLSPDGVENAVPALSSGELLSALSTGTINAVDTYRFLFGKQFVNNSPAGTFLNDSHTATAYTSDYAYVENNRTFDKAARLEIAAYAPLLGSPLQVNTDGTLTNAAIAYLEGVGETALDTMVTNNPNTNRPELSGRSVTINPAQDVLASSTLAVTIELLPIGSARNIVLNLKFTTSLS